MVSYARTTVRGCEGSHCSCRACSAGRQHEGDIQFTNSWSSSDIRKRFNGLDIWWFSQLLLQHLVFKIPYGENYFIRLKVQTESTVWLKCLKPNKHVLLIESTDSPKDHIRNILIQARETFFFRLINCYKQLMSTGL